MPELPEVETTRRGIGPAITGKTVTDVIVRHSRLRYGVPPALRRELPGQRVQAVERRGKYLLLRTAVGAVIVHLGMSGSLRLVTPATPPTTHDHVDIVFGRGVCLRLRDPRRFGAVLWTRDDPARHALLAGLGPEPLEEGFSGAYLYERARGRRQAVKLFLMDSRIVVGVGNIYANEALFLAGIRPQTPAGRISRVRFDGLAAAVRQVLAEAIAAGGTTLRDFTQGDGQPGYFQQSLRVYGRNDEPCLRCGKLIRLLRLGQRATYYCPQCQSAA